MPFSWLCNQELNGKKEHDDECHPILQQPNDIIYFHYLSVNLPKVKNILDENVMSLHNRHDAFFFAGKEVVH
jgi:hypothetical protein